MEIDLRDILLDVGAEINEAFTELMDEMTEDQKVQALKAQWRMMPDELRERLKTLQPETYQSVMKVVNGNNNSKTSYPRKY